MGRNFGLSETLPPAKTFRRSPRRPALLAGRDRAVRIDDHQHDERHHEDDREDDGDAVQVLLHDARAGLRGLDRAGYHVGDAGALAGMQQDEHDEPQAGNDQQDQHDDEERIQGFVSLL